MIRQLGTPTWFFTVSAADMKWPEMIQTIAKQYGVIYSNEDVAALSFEERSNWLRRNPVTAARHFQYRLNIFFKHFLNSTAHPLGVIVDHAAFFGLKMLRSLVNILTLWYANLSISILHVAYQVMKEG